MNYFSMIQVYRDPFVQTHPPLIISQACNRGIKAPNAIRPAVCAQRRMQNAVYRYSANTSRPSSNDDQYGLHLSAPLAVTIAGAAVPVLVVLLLELVVLAAPVLVLVLVLVVVVIELPVVDVANSLTVELGPLTIVVPLITTVPLPLLGEFGLPIMPSPIYKKFAQAMRVVLAKCSTKLRLPKNAPKPGWRET